jgi:hypothetical protein
MRKQHEDEENKMKMSEAKRPRHVKRRRDVKRDEDRDGRETEVQGEE